MDKNKEYGWTGYVNIMNYEIEEIEVHWTHPDEAEVEDGNEQHLELHLYASEDSFERRLTEEMQDMVDVIADRLEDALEGIATEVGRYNWSDGSTERDGVFMWFTLCEGKTEEEFLEAMGANLQLPEQKHLME